MNCSKCGAPNAADASFCGICGNNLKENLNNNIEQAQPVAPAPTEMPAPAAQPAAPAPVAPVEMPAPAVAAPVAEQPAVAPAPAVEPTPVAPAPVVEQPAPVAPVESTPVVAPAPVEVTPVVEAAPVAAPVEQPVMAQPVAAPIAQPVEPAVVATEPVVQQPISQPVAPMQPVVDPNSVAVQPAVAAPVAPAVTSQNLLSNKKILIPIIAVASVLILVVGLFVVKNFLGGGTGSEKAAVKEMLDPKKPILVKKSGKYGYVTHKGKVLIEPQYSEAYEFNGNYAVVSVDDAEYDYTYQIINKKGKEQLKEDVIGQPRYDAKNGVWLIDYKLYNSKLKPITKEDISVFELSDGYYTYSNYEQKRSGIMTAKGKSVWDWKEESFYGDISESLYDEKDLYVAVKSHAEDEKEVIVSLKKKKIVYELENYKKYNISAESNGIFTIKDDSSYDTYSWLFFKDGKLKYETKDSDIEEIEVYDYENQILELDYGYDDNYDREYKYYDVKAKKFLDEKPEEKDSDDEELDLYELVYGFKPFESSDKYGIMAGDKILVSASYEDVQFLSYAPFLYMKEVKNKELVLFEKNDKVILVDVKKAKEITTFDADNASSDEASSFIKLTKYNDSYDVSGYTIYNLITGESKDFNKDTNFEFGSNYVVENRGTKKIYYNTDLEQVYES